MSSAVLLQSTNLVSSVELRPKGSTKMMHPCLVSFRRNDRRHQLKGSTNTKMLGNIKTNFSGLREMNGLDQIGKKLSQTLEEKVALSPNQTRKARMAPRAAFERFTEKSIKAIVLSQEEARRLGHSFVGTEHILLGLIGEGTGIAVHVLRSMGIKLRDARVEAVKIVGMGSGTVSAELPFTPGAKRALDMSLEEARHLGQPLYIGPEHLLLGLLRVEGVASRILENLGADRNEIRAQVKRIVDKKTTEENDADSCAEEVIYQLKRKIEQQISETARDRESKSQHHHHHPVSTRRRIKVHKQGYPVDRSLDLSKFENYKDLIAELDNLFEFSGELMSPSKNWLVVYIDDQDDMMLVGDDDPWEEFCQMVRKILIITKEEVQNVNSGTFLTRDRISCLRRMK